MENYYELLGLPWGADESQVRKAWRRKVMAIHPDRNLDRPILQAGEKMAALTHAWQVLSNPAKKADYDAKFGSQMLNGNYQTAQKNHSKFSYQDPHNIYSQFNSSSEFNSKTNPWRSEKSKSHSAHDPSFASKPKVARANSYDELYFSGVRHFSAGDTMGLKERVVKDDALKRAYLRSQISSYLKARENLKKFISVASNSPMAADALNRLQTLNRIIGIHQQELKRRPIA